MFKHVVGAMAVAAGAMFWSSAYALTSTYTVTSLAAGTGSCDGSLNCTTLNAALNAANALAASPGDDIRIVFDAGLNGDIEHTGATPRMTDVDLGSTVINNYLGLGAFLVVNAARPVVIDFDNRVGAVQRDDAAYAMLYIQSDNVTVQNFQNAAKRDANGSGGYNDVAGIEGAEASIVIGGSNVTIRNGLTSDPGTVAMETCIGLVDGASNVTIEDYYCRSAILFGLYVDERATVTNVVLNRWQSEDVGQGDVYVELGEAGVAGAKTVVDGLTVSNSEFRSAGVGQTIGFRENSVVQDLSVLNSRFLGLNSPSLNVYPNTSLGTATIQNNTATNTGYFVGTDVNVAHTGPLTISNNVLTGQLNDVVFLQSPTSGTVIENNQFLNLRSAGLVAGVRIASGAAGTNNVIRANVFDQASPVTDPPAPVNRFAVWMRANPDGAGGSGSTGWSIVNNTIRNIFGSDLGPIYNDGDGDTLISGNTFGDGTRGAAAPDPAPENDDSFFVVNADSFSNGKIQTWRPTGAVYSPTTIRATFAPVDPPRAGNNAPTTPVFIDVYYTATDKAETYLGRIPGSYSSEVTYEFTYTATGGAVRAQITDANGRSSQYSGAQAVVQGLDAGADDDNDGLPNGAECVINALGIPQLCADSDLDGTPDYLDTDDDNDGIPTRVECPTGSPCVDTDGDSVPNHLDLDSDGDGISDAQECPSQACRDTDGDGAANYVDTDSDGDGRSDAIECPLSLACQDVDGNGIEDYLERPAPIVVRGSGGGAFGPWALLGLIGLALVRRRKALPFAAALGMLGATGAQAADDDSWTSHVYGGAQVGALFTEFDEDDLTRGLQDAGYEVQAESDKGDKLGYGFWLGYALNEVLGLELSYTTGADERVRYSGSVIGDLDAVLDEAGPYLKGYGDTYLLRLRYHHELSERWFLSPHVGAGLTHTRESVRSGDRRARRTEDSLTWNVGGGIHYALTPDWSVGVGADYYSTSSDNGYGMLSGIVEWRFPRALRRPSPMVGAAPQLPVQVIPPVEPPVAAIAASPESADASATPSPVVERIDLRDVQFETNSDRLTAASQQNLVAVAAVLGEEIRKHPTLVIEVAGHTDNVGNPSYNQKLSQSRARAVVEYLAAKGVDRDRLRAAGYGDAHPVASNTTAEGRLQNRRVELKTQGV